MTYLCVEFLVITCMFNMLLHKKKFSIALNFKIFNAMISILNVFVLNCNKKRFKGQFGKYGLYIYTLLLLLLIFRNINAHKRLYRGIILFTHFLYFIILN